MNTLADATGARFLAFCNHHQIDVEGEFPDCWVSVQALATVLEMVNMRKNVSGFPTEYKKKLVKDTNGGKQRRMRACRR